jgi:hypothetical protein
MEKLTLIFGGTVGLYTGYFRVFDAIEKKFRCEFRRVLPDKITGKIKDVEVECLFCINPVKDINYDAAKKFHEIRYKDVVPKPAEEVVKKVNSDWVLFFGLCGAFKGKKNEIYLPQEFHELIFKEVYVKHKEILKIKPLNKIRLENLLINKIDGEDAKAITSNVTLTYTNMENRSKENLIKIAKILSRTADIVDKETYQIAKHLNKKKLGIMLMSSDILSVKKHMLEDKTFDLDKEKFNNKVTEAIKYFLKIKGNK